MKLVAYVLIVSLIFLASAANNVRAEVDHRAKTGTRSLGTNGNSSQTPINKAITSRHVFQAEGTGVEPATGCPAPHFQCGR